MELIDFRTALRQHWLLIICAALLGLLIATALSAFTTPKYEAETSMFVSTRSGTAASDLFQGNNFTQQQVTTYAQLATTPLVLNPVIEELNLDRTFREVEEQLSAEAPAGTSLITLSATDPDPTIAADLANRTATSLIEAVDSLEQPADRGGSPVRITVVEPASVPFERSSPTPALYLAFGLILGTVVGSGVAALRHNLLGTIYGEKDVRRVTSQVVLGALPFERDLKRAPAVIQTSPHAPGAEAYRQLRTSLRASNTGQSLGSIVVTSSVNGEGRSTVSANLAVSLSQADLRVVLVEGDFRRPSLRQFMELKEVGGLAAILGNRATLAEASQPWGTDGGLDVIIAGPPPPDPSNFLGSHAMRDLIQQLKQIYDVVIFDSPPLLQVADTAELARLADGVLLIVGSGMVARQQLGRALDTLKRMDARLLGVGINFADNKVRRGNYTTSPAITTGGPLRTVPTRPAQQSSGVLVPASSRRERRRSHGIGTS